MSTFRTSIVVPKPDHRVYRAHNVTTGDSFESSELAALLRKVAQSYEKGESPSWVLDNNSIELVKDAFEKAFVG